MIRQMPNREPRESSIICKSSQGRSQDDVRASPGKCRGSPSISFVAMFKLLSRFRRSARRPTCGIEMEVRKSDTSAWNLEGVRESVGWRELQIEVPARCRTDHLSVRRSVRATLAGRVGLCRLEEQGSEQEVHPRLFSHLSVQAEIRSRLSVRRSMRCAVVEEMKVVH